MAGTEDVFMEVINELSASFGGTPTAEQLSEACDLSLDEAQQVLSELGLLPGRNAPKVKATAAKAAASKSAAAKSVAVPPLAAGDESDEVEQPEPGSRLVMAVLPGTLEVPMEEDDATVRHPSPEPASPADHGKNGETEDEVELVEKAFVPRLVLPDRLPTSQETPLSGMKKRQLSFTELSCEKRQARVNAVFVHLLVRTSMFITCYDNVMPCHAVPVMADPCHAICTWVFNFSQCHVGSYPMVEDIFLPGHDTPCHS